MLLYKTSWMLRRFAIASNLERHPESLVGGAVVTFDDILAP